MEHKPLPIGIENFEKMVKQGYYYVDKTLFLKELIDKKSQVNLFARPRRFGKTLCLSMIRYFFEKGGDSHLFDGLKIMDAGEKYASEMCKYPVISISLKDVEGLEFDQAMVRLRTVLFDEFDRHNYLMKSESIPEYNKARYERILKNEASDSEFEVCLKLLTQCLEQHHGKKVVVLIDEYDVPIEKAYSLGYYDKMVMTIRSLFHSTLKTNDAVSFAVMTGCLHVSKESIFTGFNNPKIMTIVSEAYGEYFGLTDGEVSDAFRYYGFESRLEEARSWYNGYIFGKTNVYNPWSIINFLSDLCDNPNCHPTAYWANTSSNSIVRELAELADGEVKEEIGELIRGGSITKPIHEDVVYSEIRTDMDNLWNFLFFTGYLRKKSETFDGRQKYFELVIPNLEVLTIFERKIREWFTEQVKTADMDRLYSAVLSSDAQVFEDELLSLLAETISYFDSQESFYHGFLTGVLSRMKHCRVKSNRESGNGRGDIFILPVSIEMTAAIIEVKAVYTPFELEKASKEALRQIDEKKYDEELRQLGYSNIVKYGIAFYRKDCKVSV